MTTRAQAAACASAAVAVGGDDHTLAGGEAVVLHDVGRPEFVERFGGLRGRCADSRVRQLGRRPPP